MEVIGYRTIKTAISAAISMAIAELLGLRYASAAGIISILSLQNTKRQSIQAALKRLISCAISLVLGTLIFEALGYTPWAFGVFLMFFIPISVNFELEDGIVVNSVLTTHLLLEGSLTTSLLINEFSLIVVGAGLALLFNLYMPNMENTIKKDQKIIEEKMAQLLMSMARALETGVGTFQGDEFLVELEARIKKGTKKAYKNLNNYIFVDASYYVKYMEMRQMQLDALKRMKRHFDRFFVSYEHGIMIAEFTKRVSEGLHEENSAKDQIDELDELRREFKSMELPKTREEFENRALLFQFLNDMEDLLNIKYNFVMGSNDED